MRLSVASGASGDAPNLEKTRDAPNLEKTSESRGEKRHKQSGSVLLSETKRYFPDTSYVQRYALDFRQLESARRPRGLALERAATVARRVGRVLEQAVHLHIRGRARGEKASASPSAL